jgi:hypothetical protein
MSVNNLSFLRFARRFTTLFEEKNTKVLGRWNLKDNEDIKSNFANMDCCGDSLCGIPDNYTKFTSTILEEQENIKSLNRNK